MKKLALLFITLALSTFTFADIYIIGTDVATTFNCPFNGYYNYNWSKVIWTASELSTAGVPANTPITGLGFYVHNTISNYTMLDQRIYVRNTILTEYSTETNETGTGYPDNTTFNYVFQGNITYNGSGWNYIYFTVPYTWDGTSNLEFLFENWDGTCTDDYPLFRYTSTSPLYTIVYKQLDASFPLIPGTRHYRRPNVAIITPASIPPGVPVLSLPVDGATDLSITPTLSWDAPTTGGDPTGYRIYLGTSTTFTTPFAEVNATTHSYTVPSTTPLQYNTTYYWTVSAYNASGEGTQAEIRNFTTRTDPTITTLPYITDFSTWMPTNWTQLKFIFGGTPATGGSWMQDDWLNVTYPVNKAAKINIFFNTHYDWLITPPIIIPSTGYELKFDMALMRWNSQSTPVIPGNQADDRLLIVISDNPDMSSPTVMMEWNNTGSPYVFDNIPATGGTYTIALNDYVGTKYIGFYAESLEDSYGDIDLFIDNVIIRETPSTPILTYSPTSINFGSLLQNVPSTPENVTITNSGVGTIHIGISDISIIGPNAAMFSFDPANLPVDLNAGQSVIIPVTATVTIEGPVSATFRITYNTTNYDVALSAEGLPEGTVTIGTGTLTQRQPFGILWGYERSAALYNNEQMGRYGIIEKIGWNCSTADVSPVPYKIYIMQTNDTAFTSMNWDAFIANATLVDEGTYTFSTTNWHLFELDIPFSYTSGNLVIAVETAYGEGGITPYPYFYYTTGTTGCHQFWYADNTPPTGNGTLNANIPNIMLKFEEEQPPLPVELSSFTAVLTNDLYVQLTWVSQTETNLSGYRVYRNEEKSLNNAILITPTMIPATNTTQEHCYNIVDSEVENNGTYYYWLESVDYNNSEFHGPVIVTVEGNVPPVLPEVTTLNNAYPNPFRANNSTKIEVGIKAGETGTLTIYNIRGEVVKAVKLTQGYHTINWDGIDSKGKTCGSGIYFYRLNTPSLNQIKKMVIIK